MTHVVISYRRDDTGRQAQLIRERLVSVLGQDRVFRDIDSIRLGTNFERALNEALSNATALFAFIGPEWLDVQDEHGKRRLDDPLDWVRLEIATALARDVRVVPVLVGAVTMPTEADLPGDMKALAVQQNIELSDDRFHQGVEELVRRSEEFFGEDAAGIEEEEALQAENQELRSSLKELESSLSKEKERAESVDKELHRTKSSLVSAWRWKAAGIGLMAVLMVGAGLGWYGHRSVVTTLTAESAHSPKLIQEMEEKNVKLAASLLQAEEEVRRQKRDAEAAKQQASNSLAELQRRLAEAERKAVDLSGAKSGVEETLQATQDRLKESEADNETLNRKLEMANAQLSTFNDQLAAVDTKVKQYEQAMESGGKAESELVVARRQLDESRAENARIRKALTAATEELAALKETTAEPVSTGKILQDKLQDGSLGPEMVVIPAGSFMMGSPETEEEHDKSEGPRQRVSIGKFAMGKYEVTFEEYDKFAEATDRRPPHDEGWGREKRPVIQVTWEDAVSYAEWLSRQTGKRYRLPTEAEWEYAARAGTETAYWWGDDFDDPNRANCDGCGSEAMKQTTPVGSFSTNAYGLSDTAGNVWEWVQDCWNENYIGAPKDGAAWLSGNCDRRVIRGGSWDDGPEFMRSALRLRSPGLRELNILGFRLAQDL